MAHKVVIAGMTEAKQGPWIRATGREVGVRITHLLPGEHIKMNSRDGSSQFFSNPGNFPGWIVPAGSSYMFEKLILTEGGAPTVVEVEFR